ncbi:MAG: hypothetical protein ACI9NY_000812, partial [Kiritimatiellia bacterium]
ALLALLGLAVLLVVTENPFSLVIGYLRNDSWREKAVQVIGVQSFRSCSRP